MFRKPRKIVSGILERVMATSAPRRDVLGVIPRVAMIWMPISAPNTLSRTVRIRFAGARARG